MAEPTLISSHAIAPPTLIDRNGNRATIDGIHSTAAAPPSLHSPLVAPITHLAYDKSPDLKRKAVSHAAPPMCTGPRHIAQQVSLGSDAFYTCKRPLPGVVNL